MTALPFTVRRARGAFGVHQACAVRQAAYGPHLDVSKPDEVDFDWPVFVARDKATGATIGTARMQVDGTLRIQHSVEDAGKKLPAYRRPVEVTRLAVREGTHRLVVPALMKMIYLTAFAAQASHLVVGSRRRSLTRMYERLGFERIFNDAVPLAHAGGLAHEILAFNVTRAEHDWRLRGDPLYSFMVGEHHPDIDVLS